MDVLKLLNELAHRLTDFCGAGQLRRMSDGLRIGPRPLTADLMAILQSMRAYRGCGRVSLIDAITREFKFDNRSDLAADLSEMLTIASDRLREWEDNWSGIVAEFGDAVRLKQIQTPNYTPADADYLGRIVGEVNLNAVDDLALVQASLEDVVGWIRHYIARETPSAKAEPAPLPKAEPLGDQKPKDGPRPPNEFWFNGEKITLEPIPYRLLAYMWGKEGPVSKKLVTDHVWDGAGAVSSTYGNAQGKVNKALAAVEYPKSLGQKSGFIQLS